MAEPTRDEKRRAFIDRYQDETVGLFMRAYAEAKPQLAEQNDERLGKAMLRQMRAARDLLGRIYDETFPVAKPAAGDPPATIPLKRAAT